MRLRGFALIALSIAILVGGGSVVAQSELATPPEDETVLLIGWSIPTDNISDWTDEKAVMDYFGDDMHDHRFLGVTWDVPTPNPVTEPVAAPAAVAPSPLSSVDTVPGEEHPDIRHHLRIRPCPRNCPGTCPCYL